MTSMPRLTATARNISVAPISDIGFVAVVFDPAGNAFAASATTLSRLSADASAQIAFTWPDPLLIQAGRIDVVPLVEPSVVSASF